MSAQTSGDSASCFTRWLPAVLRLQARLRPTSSLRSSSEISRRFLSTSKARRPSWNASLKSAAERQKRALPDRERDGDRSAQFASRVGNEFDARTLDHAGNGCERLCTRLNTRSQG